MPHAEVTATTEALDIENGDTGADSGSERDVQAVSNGKKYSSRAKPVVVSLNTISKNPFVVFLIGIVVISIGRYWPLSLDAYYDPSNHGENAV